MTAPTQPSKGRTLGVQLAFAGVLIVVFGYAYVEAGSWPLKAALYPRVISVGGIVLCAVLVIGLLLRALRATPDWAVEPERVAEGALATGRDDVTAAPSAAQDLEEGELDYVFGNAGRRAWLSAIGCVAAFLAGLLLTGLFVTVAVFTLGYLRLAAKASWVLTISYAVIATGVLYAGTQLLLHVPVPGGVFG